MKKTLRTGKKALSVFMAALMILTAWVFFAPEKAEAATAGKYTVKVVVEALNGFDNKNTSWTLTTAANNGTATPAEEATGSVGDNNDMFDTNFWGTGGNNKTTLFEKTYDFPTKFEMKIGKKWSTGSGKVRVHLYVNGVEMGYDTNSYSSGSNSGKWIRIYTPSDKYPYVNSISEITGEDNITMPKTNAANVTSQYSATAYDQYGVTWHADPQFWVPITEPTSYDTAKKDVTTSGLSMSGTGVLTINPSAQVDGEAASRTVWISCVAGTDKWQKKKITLNDPKYTIKFIDPDVTDPLQEKEYYYGSMPVAPTNNYTLPTPKDAGHYVFDGWDSPVTKVTQDKTYTIKFKLVPHNWSETSRIDSTCAAEGVSYQKCTVTVCGATRKVTIDKKPHTWVKSTVHAPTCLVDGYTEYYCSKCSARKNDDVTTKLGHDMKEVSRREATCLQAGVINYKCSRCTETSSTVIPIVAHSFTKETITKNPTCEGNGHAIYQCIWCGRYDESRGGRDGIDLDPTGHDWNSWTVEVPAECEKKGVEKRVCKNDASHVERRDIAQLNHDYDQTVTNTVPETCTTDGYTYHPCKHSGCDSRQTVDVIPKLGHDEVNGEWKVTKAAACETDGVKEYYCPRCNEVIKHEEIPATGHSFTKYGKAKDATCVDNEKEIATCDNGCGKTDIKEIPNTALGHKFLDEDYVFNNDAKCEIDGTETAKCTRCDVTDTRTAVGTALKHKFTNYKVTKIATCLENAEETATCDNGCGKTHTREKPNTALGHTCENFTHDEGTETCCDLGTKTGTCTRCGTVYTVKEDRAVYYAPHTYELDTDGNIVYKFVTGSETCTTDGIERAYCINDEIRGDDKNWDCETYLERTAVGTRHAHDFPNKDTDRDLFFSNNDGTCQRDGTMSAYCKECKKAKVTYPELDSKREHYVANWISDGNATCTEDGTKHGFCAYGCGTEFKDVPDDGSALGHWFRDYRTDKAPTCTEDGTRTAVCEREGCTATDTVTDVGSALGHDWSEWTFIGEKPDCSRGGTMERHCKRACCINEEGKPTVVETKQVDKTDHYYDWDIIKETDADGNPLPADCTRGYKKHQVCKVCGTEKPDSLVEVAGGAHNFATSEEKSYEPTCTEDGLRVIECTVCGKLYSEAEVIPATGHINTYLDEDTVVAPTCKDEGYTGDTKCVACDVVVEAGEAIPVTDEHTFTQYVPLDEATCTKNRTEKAVCDVCGKAENIREVPGSALGHDFTEYTIATEATCTADATKSAKCSRCDATDTVRVPHTALGHNWGDWVVVTAATCTSKGKAERKCERCGIKVEKELRMLSHTESEWIIDKEATCSEEGKRHKECVGGCGYIFKEEIIPKKPHDFVVSSCTATCIDDGISYYKCTVCGTEKSGDIVKALGHDWSGEWVVTKEPTCTKKGTETLTCTRCDKTQTRPLEALGHQVVIDPAVPATCTEPGLSEGSHCGRCGEVLKAQETVIKPHRDADGDGKCDECGKEIHHSTDLNCDCICHKTHWFMKFQYAILRFFWKLFKIGKSCDCGATHY